MLLGLNLIFDIDRRHMDAMLYTLGGRVVYVL